MYVCDDRLVEDILNRSALAFDARCDVRVRIADGMKLARGEELGGNIMTVAHAWLLCGERLDVIARFFFAPSSLQVYVPLRILEIDADPALPSGREEIFVFLGRVVRANELGVVGHRVEQ